MLQRVVDMCLAPKEWQLPSGVSSDAVFPVPLLRRDRLPCRGRRRERAVRRFGRLGFVNVLLAMLNLQFCGSEAAAVTCMTPSSAQRRVHCILSYVEEFLRGGVTASGERTIQDALRQAGGPYGPSHLALLLGLRAGVPTRACGVSLAQ